MENKNENRLIIQGEWEGGIHQGNIRLKNNTSYHIRFQNLPHKTFSVFNCKNLDIAKEKAYAYKKKISLENNLTYNQYRLITVIKDNKEREEYYEMKMQNDDLIAKFDKIDLKDAIKHKSYAGKGYERHYMTQTISHNTKKLFHRVIFPHYTQIDHINRDGLDNRRKNLRSVSIAENNVNQKKRKDNASGKTGVHFANYMKCWVVQWPEDGERKKKSFSVSKYGHEGAKLMAINHRQKMDNKNGLLNGYDSGDDVKIKIKPVSIKHIKPIKKLLSTNTSGKEGVYYIENLTGKRPYRKWCRAYTDKNGKKKTKSFFVGRKRDNAEAKRLAMEYEPVI